MFSAITTGPETFFTAPYSDSGCSSSNAAIFVVVVVVVVVFVVCSRAF
jgi:hypothetical protein